MLSSDRSSQRRVFIDTWQRAQAGLPLEPLQMQIFDILRQHPEYQSFMNMNDDALAQDFSPELGMTNPFLHMGLHLAIREQIGIDQPVGIRSLHHKLLRRLRNPHETEHRMMDCLAEGIWTLQRNQQPFSETDYLNCIKQAQKKS
ncbi:DUF1841 family protein [Chromatium okenii]|jgi:hypothetical protein|uniref:DUF1841 domain-containing protein n=1 Tax=Chromatium okenii TaxID=61644 RepID=A0A2S7XRX8_9GAMM|nr:DUF1841 family protein [Chromatium okenii]PQJ96504.1 DUF1841 domain-containing protein [Chromatium okenii]